MSAWNAERIAELRRLAHAVKSATKWGPRWIDATAAFEESANSDAVLSLLDELESVARERDTLIAALEVNNRALMEHTARLREVPR